MDIPVLYKEFLASGKVSTDSRRIINGSIFFALKGPNFDANAFAHEALEKGAVLAVVDDKRLCTDDRYVYADDPLAMLQDLARWHRRQLTMPVIALTGSNGKTTTKEMLQAVLAKKFNTSATKGNLNNHIGVPLTILAIDSSIQIAVVEMGANHLKEIASLCEIAEPTHGLITNIGKAHIGTFGGQENILRAKSELFQYLLEKKGTVFINSQNASLANMARRFQNPVFYPGVSDFYRCELLDADPYVRIRTENGREVSTHLTGGYNFENIAAALCIGKYFGIDPEDAADSVSSYEPGNMRSQIVMKGTNRIILDAYNANPSSMEAAILNLGAMKSQRRVAILGDMYELGDQAEAEHKRLGALVRESKINDVYFCGEMIRIALEEFPEGHYYQNQQELVRFLEQNPIHDSTILIKASRGMKMEKVAEIL